MLSNLLLKITVIFNLIVVIFLFLSNKQMKKVLKNETTRNKEPRIIPERMDHLEKGAGKFRKNRRRLC